MKSKEKVQQNNKKFLYILLFAVSAILLFSPLLIAFRLQNITALGLPGITLINFLASSTLFLPAPGIAATGIAGHFYNPLLVALFASVGSTLGESVAYTFGYSTKKMTHSEKNILDKITNLFHHKHTPILIFIFALIPNPFFDVMGIIAGASLFPLKRFLILVFTARFIRDAVIAYIGSTI